MIQDVDRSLDSELWRPSNFNATFGKECSRLVNCMNGQILSKQPMSNFWDGFEDVDKRLVEPSTGEEMILKLKDWPPNAEFRDKLPRWFDDLMDALPLKEYTRYNGNRNLASRLPDFFVRPDLGPKMYCAYGSVLHPEKGTTNLHLDMSDAVNVMIYVGIAQKDGLPLDTHMNEAMNLLIKGGCDEQMMARARERGRRVGALWHIWRAEDGDKIRDFLYKVAKERHEKIESHTDPIHDQSWYLDEELRTRLEKEYGVRGVAIAQCLGDAILVPAGAPHQVQNVHSCIKVAGEFVSPENVAHCLTMTQQFRNLSRRHNNHEDKLQVKNIIYHTIKDCLFVIMPEQLRPKRPLSPSLLPPLPLIPTVPRYHPCHQSPVPAIDNGIPSSQPKEEQVFVQSEPPLKQNELAEPLTTQDSSQETVVNIDSVETVKMDIADEQIDEQTGDKSITETHQTIDTTLEPTVTPLAMTSVPSPELTETKMADSESSVADIPVLTQPSVSSVPSVADSLPPPPVLRPFYNDSDSEANCDPSKTSRHNEFQS